MNNNNENNENNEIMKIMKIMWNKREIISSASIETIIISMAKNNEEKIINNIDNINEK